MSKLRTWINHFKRSVNPLAGVDPQQWLRRAQAATPHSVGVTEPEWRGVYSSLVNLFPICLPVRDGLSPRSAKQVAELIGETGAGRVVIGSFPPTYVHLVEALRELRRPVEVYAIWYNSFMQSNERLGWPMFQLLKQLTAEGRIQRLGFAKSGMAEVYNRLGIPSAFVLHGISQAPSRSSTPLAGGPHLGLSALSLAKWRKLPYAMLAAVAEVPGAIVHVAGADRRVVEFAEELRLDARIRKEPTPHAEMPAQLRQMHLNLYVTLSECCPMLPMESLAEGAPCLLGPNSHLFEDDAYLRSRLVVPYPERHEIIARYIHQALEERDEIIAAYRRWLPGYWEACQRSVADFLAGPTRRLRIHQAA